MLKCFLAKTQQNNFDIDITVQTVKVFCAKIALRGADTTRPKKNEKWRRRLRAF